MIGTITEARDGFETCILMAMHFTRRGIGKRLDKGPYKNTVKAGMEIFVPRKPEFPSHFIAFDPASDDRIYSASMDDLVIDPIAAIGSGIEIGMMDFQGRFKWSKVAPMTNPKGLVAITNKRHRWFVFHFRTYCADGREDYVRRPFALTLDGSVCALKLLGDWRGYDGSKDRDEIAEQLAMTLSILEDSKRANAFLATVEEDVKMSFPIGQEHYKRFLAMRDGYTATPTGRKNPILHWVAEHFRRPKDTPVTTHLRGAEEFIVGPMRLTISPTLGYGHE